jgi:hypothetical protein
MGPIVYPVTSMEELAKHFAKSCVILRLVEIEAWS